MRWNLNSVKIRPAIEADLDCMMELQRRSDSATRWTEDQYRRALQPASPQRLLVVAEASASVEPRTEKSSDSETIFLGFMVALRVAPEWELENIIVDPTARRLRLGTKLLEALLSAAGSTNSEAVFLEVRESNVSARSLYEKTGFEITGRRKAYYSNPSEDAVLYRLRLA
jgi:ribosomal-protein-alanine N-acetyltransferase